MQQVVPLARAQFEKWYANNKSEFSKRQTLKSFFTAKLEHTDRFLGQPQKKWKWVVTFESHQDAFKYFTFVVGEDKVVGIVREST